MTVTTTSSAPQARRLCAALAVAATALALLTGLVLSGQSPADAHGSIALRVTPGHSRVGYHGRFWRNDRTVAHGGRVRQVHLRHGRVQKKFLFVRTGAFTYSLHLAPGVYTVHVDALSAHPSTSWKQALSMSSTASTSFRHHKVIGHVGTRRVYQLAWKTRLSSDALRLRFSGHAEVTGVSVVGRPVTHRPGRRHPTPPAPSPTGTSPSTPVTPPTSAPPTTGTPTSPASTSGAPTSGAPTSGAPTTSEAPTVTPTSSSGAPANSVTPEDFGATGNGIIDDTAALQRTFDDAAGRTVYLPADHVYAHSNVLYLRVAGLHVSGPGELLATAEQNSSVWIMADNVTIDGVTIKTAYTTQRWTTWQQMGVRLDGHSGAVLRDVTVDGSAAAGIYVGGGAHDFLLDHDVVEHTRADGIHMTDGAYNGQVISPTIRMSGDDGVSVVSYQKDGVICHDISVTSPTVLGTTGGRGLSVVGGQNIAETNIDVEGSSAAGVYVAAEGNPWYTYAPTNVTITGGQITDANTTTTTDHGAVLVYSGETAVAPSNVVVSNISITDTRSTASRDIGVVEGGDPPSSILLANLTITGGPTHAYQGNAPQSSFKTRHIMQNGKLLADQG